MDGFSWRICRKNRKRKLKFYNQRQKTGEQDPDQIRTPTNQQVAATQVKTPVAAPAPESKAKTPPEEDQKKMEKL